MLLLPFGCLYTGSQKFSWPLTQRCSMNSEYLPLSWVHLSHLYPPFASFSIFILNIIFCIVYINNRNPYKPFIFGPSLAFSTSLFIICSMQSWSYHTNVSASAWWYPDFHIFLLSKDTKILLASLNTIFSLNLSPFFARVS